MPVVIGFGVSSPEQARLLGSLAGIGLALIGFVPLVDFSAGLNVTFPTGDEEKGLGAGDAVFRPYAAATYWFQETLGVHGSAVLRFEDVEAIAGMRDIGDVLGLLLACHLALVAGRLSRPADGRLHLVVIDVGQGDSLLLRSPSGRSLLVDAAGIPLSLVASGAQVHDVKLLEPTQFILVLDFFLRIKNLQRCVKNGSWNL